MTWMSDRLPVVMTRKRHERYIQVENAARDAHRFLNKIDQIYRSPIPANVMVSLPQIKDYTERLRYALKR